MMSQTEEEHTDLGSRTPDQSPNSVRSASQVTRHLSLVTGHLSLLLHFAALGLVFWGLLQLDQPLQAYMRSLHVLWLERGGDLFYYLGSGGGLVTVSALLLAGGYFLKHPGLQRCGVESLIAHGAVALFVQITKHLVGRPRPRLMRDGEFLTGPSLEGGLDSFPSGHASASFAVAVVVARHFPPWAWCAYGLAALVAVARVVRGSHFATDVAAGVVLGILVGSLVAGPLRAWRASVGGALSILALPVAAAFAILWTLCQPVADPELHGMMFWTGSIAIAFGAGSRWGSVLRGEPTAFLPYAMPAIGIGLAVTTGAWLVVLVVGLVILARRLAADEFRPEGSSRAGSRALLTEAVLAVLLVLTVLSLQGMKGLLISG